MTDILLVLTSLAILFSWLYTMHEKDEQFSKERIKWQEERNQLIDRLTANSFQEYKTSEIRLEKVKNKEREQREDVLELL